MTYKAYLQENFKPSREAVGFAAGMCSSLLLLMLSIGGLLTALTGDWSGVWAALWITVITFVAVGMMFFVSTFVYWVIVRR